ncbi:hypothetical protein BJP40_01010 [Streptomyces sp. CC53]|nr:hypothetical protein BJP40_01010 [Streptomyces sp. CC53]
MPATPLPRPAPPHESQPTALGAPPSGVTSFFHEGRHPWLGKTVRDIASRGEGTLTAIVHEEY